VQVNEQPEVVHGVSSQFRLANGRDQWLAALGVPSRPTFPRFRRIALFSVFLGLTRSWDAEVTTDFLHELSGISRWRGTADR
jgi:hypothetical protein